MAQFIARMTRAAKLEPRLYEEVASDTAATWQGLGVVLLSSLAAGIGSSRDARPGRTGRRRACGPDRLVRLDLAHLPDWRQTFPDVPDLSESPAGMAYACLCQRPRGAARLGSRSRVHWRCISCRRDMDAHRLDHCGAAGIGLYEHGPRCWCVSAGWFVHVCLLLFLLLLLGQGE